jgi:outer membrane protein assembly factor BamB
MAFVYKELKVFSPKDNLRVDETFKVQGVSAQVEDTLAELEGESHDPDLAPGTGFLNFRTKAHITAGLVIVKSPTDSEYLLVVNHKGEVILLEASGDKVNSIWNISIPGAIYRTPVLVDNNAFIVTKQGLIVAIGIKFDEKGRPLPGAILWEKSTGLTVFSKLLTTGRILIVATISGIHAYDCYFSSEGETGTFGKKVWEHRLDGLVSSPAIDGSLLFIGSEDKHFYALQYGGEGANTLWSYKTEGPIRSKPCVSTKGNFVVVGSLDGFVYCFDRVSGQMIWSFPARSAVHSDIVSYVIGNDEFFLFGNDDGNFFCVNAFGKQQWVFKTNGRIRSEALIANDTVYFGSEDNHLYGLKTITGQLHLKYNTDGNLNGKPVICGNRLYIGSTDSFVHGVYI